MWKHYCVFEKTWISVANGEPCNWCGFRNQQCNRVLPAIGSTEATRHTP